MPAWFNRACAAALALPLLAPVARAQAPSDGPPIAAGRSGNVTLEAGHGRVITLPGDAANVYVADPKVAEVRPASANSLFVFGTGVGATTLAALDANGTLLTQIQIAVLPSQTVANGAASAIRDAGGGVSAKVSQSPSGVAVRGTAASPDAANRALTASRGFVPQPGTVLNELTVKGGIQVALQVSIAEMSRSVTRELGVNWSALGTVGKYAIGFGTSNPLLVGQGITSLTQSYTNTGASISNVLAALAQDNLVRVLAQPNLTAISGETASFLVGGEFPIPVADTNNTITVAFKQYGISLAFVPTVLDSGRVNIHVRTEISALSQAGAVSLGGGNSAISIPALTVTRADTTVELGSGQSFAIAGLLQDQVTQNDNAVPWLGEVPVLGTLFRSTSFQHNKSELVIIVTPVIAAPVNDRSVLRLPGDTYVPPDDVQRNVRLHQAEARPPLIEARAPGTTLQGFQLQ